MNSISIAMFNSRPVAESVQQRLIENGRPAETGQSPLAKCWLVSGAEAGVHLDVAVSEFERAYDLLVHWDETEGLLRDAIRCPECKSFWINYPQFTRRSLIPNLFMGTLAVLRLVDKEYYCEECHYTWPREGTRRSRSNPHMAPYYFIEGMPRAIPPPQPGEPPALHPPPVAPAP